MTDHLSFLGWHSLCPELLLQPGPQRNIFKTGRGVAIATVYTGAQKLAADWVTPLQIMAHRHIVARAQPAVAVAIKEDLARHIGNIRARGVPDAPIKEDSRPWFGPNGQRACGIALGRNL